MTVQRHTLTDIDEIRLRATCVTCGPDTWIKRNYGKFYCATSREQSRGKQIGWTHGLTRDEARERIAGKICEICLIAPAINDHDHITGVLRGFICHRCNMALGWLDDGHDIPRLERLLDYARRWNG